MKPVPFEYHRAGSVAEACALLADDPDTVLIAGGQTLIPMLAMRLARPTRVVDILRIPDLAGITRSADHVSFGATTRQVDVERSQLVADELPLLFRAMPWVGHPPTRRRGTVGGSIANGDATAEIGLVAVTLGAEVLLTGTSDGSTSTAVDKFFLGPMVTALSPGAMVVGLRFPRRVDRQRVGIGFAEIAQRHGDYAMAAVATELALDEAGHCTEIRLAVGGASTVPTRLDLDGLVGSALDPAIAKDAVHAALLPLEMMEDPNTTGAYRRRAATALAGQAIAQAVAQARDDASGLGREVTH